MAKDETSVQQPKRIAGTPEAANQLASEQGLRAEREATAAPSGDGAAEISTEERRAMIAMAAYYRAERRGFTGDSPEADWLQSEAEVDSALGHRRV